MKRIKVRVTDLDSVAYYKQSDLTLEDLLRRLRREEEPSDQLLSGRAFHSVLEHASVGDELGVVEQDGWTIDFRLLESSIALPPIREQSLSRTFVVDGVEVELRGKVDGFDGVTVIDYKGASRFQPTVYIDNYQWKAYLLMTGASRFTHYVFVRKIDGRTVVMRELHRLTNYAYNGMEEAVIGSIRDYLAIAREHLPEQFVETEEPQHEPYPMESES